MKLVPAGFLAWEGQMKRWCVRTVGATGTPDAFSFPVLLSVFGDHEPPQRRAEGRIPARYRVRCSLRVGPLPGQLASEQGGERQNFLLRAGACISVNTKRNHCLFAEGAAPNTASWQYLIRLSELEGAAHTFRYFGAEIGPGCYPSGLYRELCF